MIIIHGENTIASRKKLVEILQIAKSQNKNVIRIEAKNISEAEIEDILGSTDLFETKKIIIIENLHSLPVSNKKKNFIKQLQNYQNHECVLLEKRELTKTMLKAFPSSQIFEFKASKTLFAWLDLLGKKSDDTKKIQLLHEAIESDGEYFCFLMLIRQIRMLIQIKTGESIGGAPFMLTKLRNQASSFSEKELLQIYKDILKIDIAQKTSKNILTMQQELDLLSIKL